MMRTKHLFLMAAIAVFATGCRTNPKAIFQISGHFEGSLTNHLDGVTYTQTAVSTDLKPNSDPANLPTIVLVDRAGATQIKFEIQSITNRSLTVLVTPGMAQPMTLTQDKNSGCYVASGNVVAKFCASEPEITFDLLSAKDSKDSAELLTLVMYQFKTGDAVEVKETPQAFTLSQAIERARTKSFTSRIEFEHVLQAKKRAKAAYLHLLPQLTLGTIAGNVTVAPLAFVGSFSTILQAIGDLCPFLLPDRWFQTAEAKQQSKAEIDTNILMRLDMGVQIEGLFYVYNRDSRTRDLTTTIRNRAIKIRNEVRIRENMGQLPLGSTQNLNSIVNQIQQGLYVLDQIKAEDMATISQSLGFYGPMAVSAATIDTELVPIESASPVDYETINSAALSRSYELDQMDDLIAAAKDAKKASMFNWIDPAGDPNLGLGLALPTNVAVIASQVRELGIDKQQLQSILSQKVFDAVTDYNEARKAYQQASDGMKIQKSRLRTAEASLNAGVKVDFFGLIGILQDYLTGEISLESSNTNYRIARSQIDRLLLQGYYARF